MLNLKSFETELRKNVSKNFGPLLKSAVASEQAVIAKHLNPSSEEEFDSSTNWEIKLHISGLRNFSRRRLMCLIILSWFLPEITRWELQESLRAKLKEQNLFEWSSYIHSYELLVFKLANEDDFTLSDLFGNVLKSITCVRESDPQKFKSTLKGLKIHIFLGNKPKPKKKVFRRGYNDHGSEADPSQKARTEELQNEGTQFVLEEELRKTIREHRFSNQILIDLLRLEQGYRQ